MKIYKIVALLSILLPALGFSNTSTALKIIEELEFEVIPEVLHSDSSKEHRELKASYMKEATLHLAAHLDSKMSKQELDAVLKFIQSPEGKKFYQVLGEKELLEESGDIVDRYISDLEALKQN